MGTRSQRGAALAVTLMLLTILTVVATSATGALTANIRLTASLQLSDRVFARAAAALHEAVVEIDSNPDLLPATGTAALPETLRAGVRTRSTITYLGTNPDTRSCPAPYTDPGTRHDFEIRATAQGPRNAISHQRVLFAICRDLCGTSPCIETRPLRMAWFVTRPDS